MLTKLRGSFLLDPQPVDRTGTCGPRATFFRKALSPNQKEGQKTKKCRKKTALQILRRLFHYGKKISSKNFRGK